MATTIRANIPNGNSTTAEIYNTEAGVKIEISTSEGDTILSTVTTKCVIVEALYPLNRAGDVGIWVPDLATHIWVGRVAIADGTAPVEVRTNGLFIEEDA